MPDPYQVARFLLIAAALAGFLLAAISDIRSLEIPNWLCGALAVLFLPVAFLAGLGWETVLVDHLAVGLLVLVLGMGIFALGWMGGGDIKLLAAASIWMGWGMLLPFFFMTALVGGGVALVILLLRTPPGLALLARVPSLEQSLGPEGGLPYGVAIGGAALYFVPQLHSLTQGLPFLSP